MFKEELTPILNNLSQQMQKKTLPVHFIKLELPWYQNQTDSTIKEKDISIFFINIDKKNSLKS